MDYFDVSGNRENIGRGPAKDYRLDYDASTASRSRRPIASSSTTTRSTPTSTSATSAATWPTTGRINRRLTLNLGLRYAHDSGFEGETCREDGTGPGAIVYPAQCFGETADAHLQHVLAAAPGGLRPHAATAGP